MMSNIAKLDSSCTFGAVSHLTNKAVDHLFHLQISTTPWYLLTLAILLWVYPTTQISADPSAHEKKKRLHSKPSHDHSFFIPHSSTTHCSFYHLKFPSLISFSMKMAGYYCTSKRRVLERHFFLCFVIIFVPDQAGLWYTRPSTTIFILLIHGIEARTWKSSTL